MVEAFLLLSTIEVGMVPMQLLAQDQADSLHRQGYPDSDGYQTLAQDQSDSVRQSRDLGVPHRAINAINFHIRRGKRVQVAWWRGDAVI